MGLNFSALCADPYWSSLCLVSASPSQSKPGLGDLPESCVASIIEYLDPPEICKLAKLSRAFRGASWADCVWESKLPSNYRALIKKVFGDCLGNLGKREIYSMLCRVNTIDGGSKKVWLDKNTGGVCLAISSKGLAITGIDDRRYWNHIPTVESRFCMVAYLQQIWWFEVDGEVEFPFPAGTYSLFFRLQLGLPSKRFGRRICNTEHVHGWDIKPVRFQLWTTDGQYAASQCTLTDPGNWDFYHVADFVVHHANASTKIKFSMTQIDCTHTKGGLCLDFVLVCPSNFRERLKHF
ncbi:PP2 domain-containing protein [Cephalotus follicularis]|uniref:PP2 domain-containing protein n=1 Tax=Cephalotus follicularis TaxID=3775 RepID=A0A1Q3DIL1_CEPFO|nr:PP2 domain-containing protein [Cephalotus follicularis]